MIKYFSMFSGIGGFEVGIEKSKYGNRFESVGFSEIDEYATSIYKKHYPNTTNYGDATKIKTEELPEFDFLVGGFPCQSFSIAGRQKGLDDTRGTLFFEIARILKDKRPGYFLLENVRGLLSHDAGKTFQTVLEVLSSLGYCIKWEIYNSKDYGVPQRRERIFIKGYSRKQCGREILSFGRCDEKDNGKLNESVLNDDGDVIDKYFLKIDENRRITTTKDGNALCLHTTRPQRPLSKRLTNYVLEDHFTQIDEHRAVTTDKEKENYYAVTTRPRVMPLYKKQDNYVLEDKRTIKKLGSTTGHQSGGVYDAEGISPALCSTDYKNPVKIVNNYRIRKLTPLECERLQGFEDNWTEYGADGEKISDTQRYKCIGNAVTTNVISHIINEMFCDLDE